MDDVWVGEKGPSPTCASKHPKNQEMDAVKKTRSTSFSADTVLLCAILSFLFWVGSIKQGVISHVYSLPSSPPFRPSSARLQGWEYGVKGNLFRKHLGFFPTALLFPVLEASSARIDTRFGSPGEILFAPPREREISIQRTGRIAAF